jgi:hypothetical protein
MPSIRQFAPLLGGALLAVMPVIVRAQEGTEPGRPIHLKQHVFQVPFEVDRNDVKYASLKQLKLYISDNNGVSWELHATAAPGQGFFDVRVERDGPYAFALQSVYYNGESIPQTLDQLRTSRYVVVDTERPSVILQPLPTRPANDGFVAVGVTWKVTDDNLDLRNLRLEVRWAGQSHWVPITDKQIGPQGDDIRSIRPGQRMEYRLRARDKAGNVGEQSVVVGSDVGPASPGLSDRFNTVGTGRAITRPKYTLVNHNRVAIDFVVKEKGKSGIAALDLWVTTNRADWKKVEQSGSAPVDSDKVVLYFDAPQDGLYGFTGVARSGANIGDLPPTSRDEPQIWVEVDTKPPEAKFLEVRFALPNDPRTMLVTWEASDKNLDVQPIILQYCEGNEPQSDKDWKDVNPAGPLSNTGKHVFPTPNISGFQFRLRMKVFDRAGNQTVVTYEKPIVVDLVRPRVEITGASPAK